MKKIIKQLVLDVLVSIATMFAFGFFGLIVRIVEVNVFEYNRYLLIVEYIMWSLWTMPGRWLYSFYVDIFWGNLPRMEEWELPYDAQRIYYYCITLGSAILITLIVFCYIQGKRYVKKLYMDRKAISKKPK